MSRLNKTQTVLVEYARENGFVQVDFGHFGSRRYGVRDLQQARRLVEMGIFREDKNVSEKRGSEYSGTYFGKEMHTSYSNSRFTFYLID